MISLFLHSNEGQREVCFVELVVGKADKWHRWAHTSHPNVSLEAPHTQTIFTKSGEVSWQTVPEFRSSTHSPQMIFIKITPGQSRQTASSEQFTGFHLSNIFSYQKVTSRTISYRNVACWLTKGKTACLDSSIFFFMWPLAVLNNKKPNNLVLQEHCTPLTAVAWVICTLCAPKSLWEFYKH